VGAVTSAEWDEDQRSEGVMWEGRTVWGSFSISRHSERGAIGAIGDPAVGLGDPMVPDATFKSRQT
jgi:hypothetical protein